jgi:hypothetical protein
MRAMANPEDFNPADLPDYPPTDETGDVDLSLIDYNLSLTPAQRMEEHAAALSLVRALEQARIKRYGQDAPPAEATD